MRGFGIPQGLLLSPEALKSVCGESVQLLFLAALLDDQSHRTTSHNGQHQDVRSIVEDDAGVDGIVTTLVSNGRALHIISNRTTLVTFIGSSILFTAVVLFFNNIGNILGNIVKLNRSLVSQFNGNFSFVLIGRGVQLPCIRSNKYSKCV